jgi:methylaspartate ammonia-lyase
MALCRRKALKLKIGSAAVVHLSLTTAASRVLAGPDLKFDMAVSA